MITENALWKMCGVMTVDHVAVTTGDLGRVLQDYMSIPGSELLRGPGVNTTQNVDFAFVKLATGMVVEILGVKQDSPISEHVNNGGGAYHLCFTVEDLESAITCALEHGAIQVVKPREDDAFDGRRVSFLMHSDHGLFEFIEAMPKKIVIRERSQTQYTTQPNIQSKVESDDDPLSVVEKVFLNLLPELADKMKDASYDVTPEWTSFKHLQIFMEIEQLSGAMFTAEEISSIQDFNGIVKALTKKLEKL